jgi:hypothetical protein
VATDGPTLPLLASKVWADRRPVVYELLEDRLIRFPRLRSRLWWLYWNVYLRLRFWSWWPAANPRTTYWLCLLVAAITIGISRSRA